MNRMRIACPSCGAEYDVPDRLLAGAGRTLRCSRCGTDFALPQVAPAAVAVPPAPPPAPEPAAVPAAPEPEPEPPSAPVPPQGERHPVANGRSAQAALLPAWVASLLVVGGGAVALLLFRAQVMAAWPPATRLFAALGLA